jgi:gliding motility-associated-like protein
VIGGSTTLVAQMPGLCDPANRPIGAVEGSFEIIDNITIGCSPLEIKVRDLSLGGTDIYYDFRYEGEGVNYLKGKRDDKDVLTPTDNRTTTYTILQYGVKNGNPMYTCKQVTVKPHIDFSYTLCNVNENMEGYFELQIPPQNPLPNYNIQYKLGSETPVNISFDDLPYNLNSKLISVPTTIEIYAIDAIGNKVCQRPIQSITSSQNNPFKSHLSNLEMVEVSKARLTLVGASGGKKYELFRAESGNNYANTEVKIGDYYSGEIDLVIPDSTKSYCFFVRRDNNYCGSEEPPDLCTIPLDSIDYSINSNTLSWKNHTDKIYNFHTSRHIKSVIELEINETSANPIIQNPLTSPYIHTIDCKNNYCYQIVSEVKDSYNALSFTAESRSIKRCISRKDIKAPPITTLHTSVDGDKVAVNFTDDAGWPLSKPYFFLYHSPNGNFTKADSTNSTNSFQYTLQDPNQQSLCFKVGYIDQCGSHSQLSPEVCTLHLTYVDPDLAWSSENPFSPRAIGAYEIEEVLPNTANVGSTSPNVHTFTPDFGDQELEITYRIKAIDSNGNFSFSNVLSVLPVFGIYLPTAFSPNGDFLNEDLILKGKKGMIKDFSLEIFDRDRNKIYSTQDKDFSWNGKINDEAMSPGTYSLFIKASLINGEVITLTEIITILY